jgi:hypothetical protein
MKRLDRFAAISLFGLIGSLAAATALAESNTPDPLEVAIAEQLATDRDGAASQQRVEALDDESRELLERYQRLVSETKSMNAYGVQLSEQVASQTDEIGSVQKQLGEIENTAREVMPMMEKMVGSLERLVALDVPFLLEERTERVESLKAMMKRADVTVSEKYRRVIEAYQIELDYGRNLESYEGKLPGSDDDRAVQFLRIGRIALLYQSLDGKETGYWDGNSRTWVVDNDYLHAVKEGLAVATKQGAPELLIAPVAAPQEFEQ